MKRSEIYRTNRLTTFARSNRKNPTFTENKLWNIVRNRRVMNYKFRRPVPILSFIVDFYCKELKLVI